MKKVLLCLLILLGLCVNVCAAEQNVVQVILSDGTVQGSYSTFAEGVANTPENGYLRLLADITATDTVAGELYLDLNGHTLQGITITGTLYGMDSATDDYSDGKEGKLIPAAGAPAPHVKTTVERTGFVRRYLAVATGNSYRFPRYYMGITNVSMKPDTAGVGYKATFAGNVAFRTALDRFGYRLWVSEDQAVTCGYGSGELKKVRQVTLLLENFLSQTATDEENAARAEMTVYAEPYVTLKDGTELRGSRVSYDFRQMLELITENYETYEKSRQDALQTMSATFSGAMLGWDIPELHHATGSVWEAVDNESFKSKLTASGSNYLIPSGSYVLTEDLDLSGIKIRINGGQTVSICFNGHTITTNKRMFEQYGTLNLCDCHVPEEEGGITSSHTGTSATYAAIAYCRYESVTNIYGGHLKGTGQTNSAGLFAISHDGGTANASKVSAVLNVYGGSFSGGNASENGGLVGIWNGGTANIYGGEFYGGSAGGRGGAIDLNTAAGSLNIYGGKFYNNTGKSGGAISTLYGTTTICGGEFYDNTATGNGGAVYAYSTTANLTIQDGEFHGNSATGSGGGVYSYGSGSGLILRDATFRGNTAGGDGGAVYNGGSSLTVQGGSYYENASAGNGGAFRLGGRSILHLLENAKIYDNTAAGLGNGVYLTKSQAELSGALSIRDNLYMDFYSMVNADSLTQGADVMLSPEAMTTLGTESTIADFVRVDTGYTLRSAYGSVGVFQSDVTPATDGSGFRVGFGESDITPQTIEGMPLTGFSNAESRLAVDEGREVWDDIVVQSVAITDENGETVILIFCDLITYSRSLYDYIIDAIAAATGVPEANIFINCSHSHSAPSTGTTSMPIVVEYNRTLPNLFARSALQAMHDRAPATMETGSFEVKANIDGKGERYLNFYRHYSYEEDGIVKYFGDQFGKETYNGTTNHVRDADHTMHLVRFTRDGKDILMSNWRIHPHRTGGEKKYKLSADVIGTLRYYMAQEMPDTHFVYYQGAAGNINSTSRMSAYNHGLDYVTYGKALAGCIVDNLDCLESREIGPLQVDHYEYLAKADTPTDEEYAKAKAVYDIFLVETEGMTLGQKNTWVRNYCVEHPEYNYVSGFQLSFIVNRRYNQKDTYLPLNVVTLGKSFGFYTAPGEMWDAISMAVEDATDIDTVFCIGYSMDHQHYFVYYPEYVDMEDGVPYVSYESENRHFVAPNTVQEMIAYWAGKLNEFVANP